MKNNFAFTAFVVSLISMVLFILSFFVESRIAGIIITIVAIVSPANFILAAYSGIKIIKHPEIKGDGYVRMALFISSLGLIVTAGFIFGLLVCISKGAQLCF